MDVFATLAIVLGAAVGACALAAIVYAIVQITREQDLSDLEKLVWIVAVVCAPVVGSLVWYFAGPHPFGLRLNRQFR
jgi:hypothetical protein